MYKVLYLPIEESARELEARLILALCALRDGWKVVVGHQLMMTAFMRIYPVGVYFAKGTNSVQLNKIMPLKERGFGIVAIEEENVPLAEPLLMKNLMAGNIAELIDIYLAHGPFDADVVGKANPAIAGKLETVGVGRFDLLKPAFLEQRQTKTGQIRGKYGDFVLLNTNFGYANSFIGSPEKFFNDLLVGMKIVDLENPAEVALWERALEFETRTMEGFKQLARRLAEDVPVVIRPHTSENLQTWQALEQERDWGGRLSVVREGPVVDWLLASRLVVQNSCTTGLEAGVMGAPVISFTPFDNGMLSCFVANRVLPRVDSIPGVLEIARRAVAGDRLAEVTSRKGGEPLANFIRESDTELVSERQWRSIREKFDATAKEAPAEIFPQGRLSMQNEHPQYKVKYSVSNEQFSDAMNMVMRSMGGSFPFTARVVGDGFFELAPASAGARPSGASAAAR